MNECHGQPLSPSQVSARRVACHFPRSTGQERVRAEDRKPAGPGDSVRVQARESHFLEWDKAESATTDTR